MNKKQVIEYKDFGFIYVKLDDLMKKYGITTYELSNRANVRFNTIKNLRENKSLSRIDFEVLAKLCYVLNCDLTDIIDYVPPKA